MGILSKIFAPDVTAPVQAVGAAFDELFTSDDEKAAAAVVMEKLRQNPGALQVELNKIEAGHASVFVAGWRPFIGWVCGVSLGMYFIPQYALGAVLWIKLSWVAGDLLPYPVENGALMELVLALLGMGALRTVETLAGKARDRLHTKTRPNT